MQTRTSTMLLEGLRDPRNGSVWSAFDARYRPILAGVARRMGFSASDAEEVAQQTLCEFVAGYAAGRYRREEGRLSSWLLGTAMNVARSMRRRERGGAAEAMIDVEGVAEETALRGVWEEQQQLAILGEALRLLRASGKFDERTLEAFELVGPRGLSAAEAGRLCGMTTAEVYVAKHRVASRLRQLVAEVAAGFDEGPSGGG